MICMKLSELRIRCMLVLGGARCNISISGEVGSGISPVHCPRIIVLEPFGDLDACWLRVRCATKIREVNGGWIRERVPMKSCSPNWGPSEARTSRHVALPVMLASWPTIRTLTRRSLLSNEPIWNCHLD